MLREKEKKKSAELDELIMSARLIRGKVGKTNERNYNAICERKQTKRCSA